MIHIPVVKAFLAARLGLLGLTLAGLALACGPSAAPESFGGVATAIPAATGIPVVTAMPLATAAPDATAIPAATAMPFATGIPAATAVPAATRIPAATAMPATTAVPAARLPSVGTQAGALVHPFTIKLAGGAQVTSQELLVQHRPTFLFFFASW